MKKSIRPGAWKRSLTLIELLMVMLMMSVISLALYTTLSKGVEIWKRSTSQDSLEDLNIFFEKFASDVRNTFSYLPIAFLGKNDELEFASLVFTAPLADRAVGKVAYRFDAARKEIIRQQYSVSQMYKEEEAAAVQVLKDVAQVKFLYYFYDEGKKEYGWSQEWLKDALPLAVSVGVSFDEADNETRYVRTVRIPVIK